MDELPFAKIIILRDDIAEVMINDGIEMNLEMVNQYHDFLLSHLHAFSLLVNKVNAHNRMTEITTQTLASFPRHQKWNINIFSDRDNALAWLKSVQKSTDSIRYKQLHLTIFE